MREKILAAARFHFIEHGYAGISMREIAASVGVSKPALYYYFRDKEGLFLAIVFEFLDEMSANLQNLVGENSRQRLANWAQYMMNLPFEQRALIRLLSQESGHLPEDTRIKLLAKYQECFLGRIEAIIETGMEAGEFRRMSAHVVVWALLGLLYPYTFVGTPGVHADGLESALAADQVLDIFFKGVQSSI